jgi:hypothetical protein
MKTLPTVKILPVTLFKVLVAAYRKPPVIFRKLEIILKRVTVLLSYQADD